MVVCWERYIGIHDVEHLAQTMNRRTVATVTAGSRPQSERALPAAEQCNVGTLARQRNIGPWTGVERRQRGHFRITCHLVSALFNLAEVRVGISMHCVGDGFRIDRIDEDQAGRTAPDIEAGIR